MDFCCSGENMYKMRTGFDKIEIINILVGWGGWRQWGGVCDASSRQITEVKHTFPQPVTGMVSRLVFKGSIPVLHTNLWLFNNI